MTRKRLETVVEEGRPFTIRLADDRSYAVPHRDCVSLHPKNATVAAVYEDDGTVHVLPLLTMTGALPSASLPFPLRASALKMAFQQFH